MHYLIFKRLTLPLAFSLVAVASLLATAPTPTPAPKARVKSTRATGTAKAKMNYKQNSVPLATPRPTPEVKYKQNSVPFARTRPTPQVKYKQNSVPLATPAPTPSKWTKVPGNQKGGKKGGGLFTDPSLHSEKLTAPGDKLKKLPDLVLVEITKVGMHISNKGTAPSGPCHAKVICWGDSQHPTIKDADEISFNVPALQPGADTWIQMRCPKGWGAYVDWASEVHELNEQNNEIDLGAAFDNTKD